MACRPSHKSFPSQQDTAEVAGPTCLEEQLFNTGGHARASRGAALPQQSKNVNNEYRRGKNEKRAAI